MFYGTISSDGSIDSDAAHSNDFSVDKGSSGTYVITFNQYMHYKPALVATAISNNTGSHHAVNAEWSISGGGSEPFKATVTTSRVDQGASHYPFTFRARTGMTKIFTAETLSLTPEIIDFRHAKVLALSTTIDGKTVYLDKGTVLIGVGTSMKLALVRSSVSDGGSTWSLSGWTYGGGSGPSGAPWSTDDGAPYFKLETDPSGSGPATTPYTFAIKGVRTTGSGQQYVSTDPVVRLSSVPPGGISL